MGTPLKIVLTGASSGIGAFLALRLREAGHDLWNWSRRPPGDPTLRHTPCDVSDWERVREAAGTVGAEWSRCDALICLSATQGPPGEAAALDPLAWSRTVRTNLDGTFYAIRALHPLLVRAARRPKILCFSGGGATFPRPRFSAYGASKAAVVRLVETLSLELTDPPIDINAVAPGAIATRMTDEVIAAGPALAGADEYRQASETRQTGGAPLDRVLGLVSFLLSESSDGLSGRLISAQWDRWEEFSGRIEEIMRSDRYTLRRRT